MYSYFRQGEHKCRDGIEVPNTEYNINNIILYSI